MKGLRGCVEGVLTMAHRPRLILMEIGQLRMLTLHHFSVIALYGTGPRAWWRSRVAEARMFQLDDSLNILVAHVYEVPEVVPHAKPVLIMESRP